MNDYAERLYNLKLGEQCSLCPHNLATMTRVPGGWIYTEKMDWRSGAGSALTCCFVPFNNEFQGNYNGDQFG